MVYDGSLNPEQVSYAVNNLIPGLTYNFQLKAIDYNGQNSLSAPVSFLSCIPPSGVKKPRLANVDRTTFTIVWDLPQSNGGCPITGYAIYRDDGAGGLIVMPVDPVFTANNPYLFSDTSTLSASSTGMTFRVKIEAINAYGSTLSPALQFVLADAPGIPTPAPYVDITNTTTYQILVSFANTNPDNGGSPLIA